MTTTPVDVLLVIPARLASTRLPEKALLRETGKYLVQHVYERACRVAAADAIVVATDHERIVAAVESFGGRAMLTSVEHRSGTDRAAEVARRLPAAIVVNVQGDEPELEPGDVDALVAAMRDGDGAEMGTLVHDSLDDEAQADPSVVKAVVEGGWAVDFRREPTPGGRRHLGIYAYRATALERFTAWEPTGNETARRLEQMRMLDHGGRIRAVPARHCGVGIDTPADYAAFAKRTADRRL